MRIIGVVAALSTLLVVNGFTIPTNTRRSTSFASPTLSTSSTTPTTSTSLFEYIRPEISEAKSKLRLVFPKVGDLVRYYDLDGGQAKGQELVGKLSFIQASSGSSQWLAEVTELDDVGEGYYAEYPSRKRRKSKLIGLETVSPLMGSYVRTEDAFKIPTDAMGNVRPYMDTYSLEEYEGPMAIPVDESVLQEDLNNYSSLKGRLLRDAAIAGFIGTIIADLIKGFDDALVYFFGAIAGVGYLFFLGIKTDTLGSVDAKMGTNVSNLRFFLPVLVLVGVALQNVSMGSNSPMSADGSSPGNMLSFVSQEQFAAAMLGFLTYRIPLFTSQLVPIISETAGATLPGSAGVAMQMARDAKKSKEAKESSNNIFDGDDLTTVLVVSGPSFTGKSDLVKRLIDESEGKLIAPKYLDKVADPIIFEQMEGRNGILKFDTTGRYGLTKDSLVNAARKPSESGENAGVIEQVVVVDADVDLAKKLTNVGGLRLVGVWVGLDQLEKFEDRLTEEIDSGKFPIPEDETPDSFRRAKIREIVKDIEYGVVSGIFEFTVLNDSEERSMMQLKNAAEYCFK